MPGARKDNELTQSIIAISLFGSVVDRAIVRFNYFWPKLFSPYENH